MMAETICSRLLRRKPVAALHEGAPGQVTWLEDPPTWLMTWLEDHRPGSGSALPIALLR